jgi:drug/metabolite transporter (DMT)-like permease
MQISRGRFLALYGLMCLIWGSTWMVIHIGVDAGLQPFTGAALRFGLATIFMWILVKFQKTPFPSVKREIWWVILIGFLSNGVSFSIVYSTAKYVPSGLGAVIFGTMPLWTAIFAHYGIEAEQLSASKVFGILLGILGIIVIFYPQMGVVDPSVIFAMLLLLGSPIVSAVATVFTKKHTHHVSPIMLNAITTLVGFLVIGTLAFISEDPFAMPVNGTVIWTICYLAFLGTVVSFLTYFRLMKVSAAVTMSYVALITPVIAIILGWAILKEQLGVHDFIGAALVMFGVTLSLRKS